MSEAAKHIEFWFDFGSPYAFFASHRVPAIAERFDRRLLWRPFVLGAAFKATGMGSLSKTPMRGDYARRDWGRLSRRMGLKFALPPNHPVNAIAAARAFYAIEQSDPSQAEKFAQSVFSAYFGEGLDIGSPDVVAQLAGRLGANTDEIVTAIQSPAIKQLLRDKTDEALSRGVFGSPFTFVDGEPFWGNDRLDDVEDWLKTGGW